MTKKEPKSSVLDEQFGKTENTKDKKPKSTKNSKAKAKPVTAKKKKTKTNAGKMSDNTESVSEHSGNTVITETSKIETEVNDVTQSADGKTVTGNTEEIVPHFGVENEERFIASDDLPATELPVEVIDEVVDNPMKGVKNSGEATPSKYSREDIDYTQLSKEDLVKVLREIVGTGMIADIRKDVDAIKSSFYKKHKQEVEEIRKRFLSDGGLIQDFKIEETPLEIELKELLNNYRDLRNDVSKKVDDEKLTSLEEKYRIIENIKELVNSQESLNKTFQEFRELQNRWREIGPVPQQNIKDLWESYHYHVEAFYDYIKINKELRDLDLRKNLEAKTVLCETAESLLLEPSVVEAFRKLQKLHDQWREIGPVPIEKRGLKSGIVLKKPLQQLIVSIRNILLISSTIRKRIMTKSSCFVKKLKKFW